MSRVAENTQHVGDNDTKLPEMAVLAGPALQALLEPVCDKLHDLNDLSPNEIVLRHGDGLILVEQGVPGYDQLVLLLAAERPSTALIVISDHLPAHLVRSLMRMEASDILPTSVNLSDVLDAADRLNETIEEQKAGSSVQCWAFRGAVGGAGTTTIAIEAAFNLARKVGPGKVCLVDLNVADGMVTSFLEAVPKLDLKALSNAPERLDPRLLASWSWTHEDGVAIIASPRDQDADVLATEPAILRLLDVACNSFEFVIIDMPRHMMPWTKSVLSAVDQAIVCSELTVPSLHAAADCCRETDIVRGDLEPTKLVLNRMFPKKRFRAEFAVDTAEKSIERKIDATVASDWDAAVTSANLGKPIADVKPKSQLVADVAGLVETLLPEDMVLPQREQSKRRRRK